MPPNNKEGMLQEYIALRSEILDNFNQRTSRLNIVWASVSALIAAGAISKIPEFACLALLVVSSGWIVQSGYEGKMGKIGSYIRIFLEPNLVGVKWQTINYEIRNQSKQPSRVTRLIREIFSTYGILSVICIIAMTIFIVEFPAITTLRFALLLSLSFVSFVYWLVALRRAVSKNPQKVWDKIYTEFSEKVSKKPSR